MYCFDAIIKQGYGRFVEDFPRIRVDKDKGEFIGIKRYEFNGNFKQFNFSLFVHGGLPYAVLLCN